VYDYAHSPTARFNFEFEFYSKFKSAFRYERGESVGIFDGKKHGKKISCYSLFKVTATVENPYIHGCYDLGFNHGCFLSDCAFNRGRSNRTCAADVICMLIYFKVFTFKLSFFKLKCLVKNFVKTYVQGSTLMSNVALGGAETQLGRQLMTGGGGGSHRQVIGVAQTNDSGFI
jgi:hypothetical protein